MLNQSLEMTKVDRNMSELRKIVCKNIILTLVHLLALLCELFVNARTWVTLKVENMFTKQNAADVQPL
jgi:hypothetical protein